MNVTEHERQLTEQWARSDWRESLFAPRSAIIQALTKAGQTASGVADNREDALLKCLGETAEKLALHQATNTQADSNKPTLLSNMDGIAAHPQAEEARRNAYLEAHERLAVSEWWKDQRPAKKICKDWLANNGITPWLKQLRSGANIKRVTTAWLIEPESAANVSVVVSRSQYANGQDPILGFGASHSPFDAVKKAMLENVLMEINLIEVLAARSGYSDQDMTRVETKIANYASRGAALLKSDVEIAPGEGTMDAATPLLCEGSLQDAQFSELSHPELGWPVWGCHLPDRQVFQPASICSPFI